MTYIYLYMDNPHPEYRTSYGINYDKQSAVENSYREYGRIDIPRTLRFFGLPDDCFEQDDRMVGLNVNQIYKQEPNFDQFTRFLDMISLIEITCSIIKRDSRSILCWDYREDDCPIRTIIEKNKLLNT